MTTFILLPLASAMKTLIAVIIVIITTSQAIKAEHHEEHSQQQHKKEHLGFFVSSAKFKPFAFILLFLFFCQCVAKGSRGRRSVNTDPSTTIESDEGNEANVRELTNLRDTIMGMQRNVRAPKGFFGMRGKKDFDLQTQEKRALLGIQQVCSKEWRLSRFKPKVIRKKIQKNFNGFFKYDVIHKWHHCWVRKGGSEKNSIKIFYENLPQKNILLKIKRQRGEQNSLLVDVIISEWHLSVKMFHWRIKRSKSFPSQNLNGLRERTRFVEPPADENDGYPSYLPKRAPAQGFFGMRGKKFGDYDLGGSVNDKRAPKGFMGMRGKKSGPDRFDDEEIDDPQVFDYNYNSIYDKRAPSGFMGVRGKKLFSE